MILLIVAGALLLFSIAMAFINEWIAVLLFAVSVILIWIDKIILEEEERRK